MLPVAILAGGRATRLGEIAVQKPKILVEIEGRPFAEHQLEWLREQGVQHVIYCLGHLGEQVVATLGDGARWGMRFDFVMDGPVLLGTGGALRRAIPGRAGAFFVLYGDSLLTCDLAAVEQAYEVIGKRCLMTVLENGDQWDTSNVVYREGQIVAYDKNRRLPEMRFIDYGLGILTSEVLERYPADHAFDLAQVYQDELRAGQLAGYEVGSRFYEIGSPRGLDETRAYVSGKAATRQ